MPEFDNDRLEQFFRKAAGKPDVTFNEDDWKKLEARLDATGTDISHSGKKAGYKIVVGVAVGLIFLLSGVVWLGSGLNQVANEDAITIERNSPTGSAQATTKASPTVSSENAADETDSQKAEEKNGQTHQTNRVALADSQEEQGDANKYQILSGDADEGIKHGRDHVINVSGLRSLRGEVTDYGKEKIFNQLIKGTPISPAVAEKIKQKAVELPGAEEETRGAEAVVREEHASEQKKHESLSRLSLLLSFAPDFSSTSHTKYTAPGKAFGAMVHYHIGNRWSLSAGAIKNAKKYRGAGEDYHPPAGYWKYYTNGIIPYTIDGSCSVLEFPIMLQYTLEQNAKSRWLAGAGASSYLMLNESYRYNFEQPNPGAKEGWDSRNSSRFLFNMVNFTVAYERRVLPGLMIGIEPYVKIPVEQIGWSNLRLYSTGASITVRYALVRRQTISTPARSRGPD